MNDMMKTMQVTGLLRSTMLAGLATTLFACDSAGGGGGYRGGGSGGELGDDYSDVGGAFPAGECPIDAASMELQNAATYAVVVKYRVGPNPQDVVFSTVGTAFAIGDRHLATNAHITESFNEPQPAPIEDVFAVQAGTGKVVELTRALTHPKYLPGQPLTTPDVGLLTSHEVLPTHLPLASIAEAESLRLGDMIQIVGFPGDVNDILRITPGTTIPQATSLSGAITAFRNHKSDVAVTPATTDVLQHQAPTTPGTSGSAMVRCGKVIGANNAGTVKLVVTIKDGQTVVDRQAAAANNFGVHARYLHEMVSLFLDNAVQGFALPPAFVAQNPGPTNPNQLDPNQPDQNPPNQNPPGPTGIQAFVGTYSGGVQNPANASHGLQFTVRADGTITGGSAWPQTGNFGIIGEIDAQGNIVMIDDAFERAGFMTGIYFGFIDAEGIAQGVYAEGDENNILAEWIAAR